MLRGKAVHVEPMEPTLKASGIKCLKLEYDTLLSSFAININCAGPIAGERRAVPGGRGRAVRVEPMTPKLKAPGIMFFKLKYDEPLSNFAFEFNLRRYDVLVASEATRLTDAAAKVDRCRLTVSTLVVLKAPIVSALETSQNV